MNREELERRARVAMATAGDMAARGMEWVRNYRDTHREIPVDDVVHDGNRRIYGVTNLAQQSAGFRAFNAFRLMITPMLIRIFWFLGAYIAYPITMIFTLAGMSQSRYVTSGDMWKVFGISIIFLILYRLLLESIMAIFRIHESSTKTAELMGRLVRLEESRKPTEPKEDGNA